jgi:hypothetical protein
LGLGMVMLMAPGVVGFGPASSSSSGGRSSSLSGGGGMPAGLGPASGAPVGNTWGGGGGEGAHGDLEGWRVGAEVVCARAAKASAA